MPNDKHARTVGTCFTGSVSSKIPVLVVEDDEAIREVLTEALYEAGFEVHGALDGADALAVIATDSRPWLVLLDLNMPRVDGWTFLDALNASNATQKNVRVLVLSAQPRAAELEGKPFVRGVLAKPIDMPSLIETMKRVAALPS